MNITTRALIRTGKPAFFLTTVFAVVGAVFLFPRWSNANAPGYKLAVLERGPIVSTVAATGTINPITTVIVGSQLSGQVVGILADYNDKVTAGQILARLNSDQIRFKRDAAKADLEQARATQVMQEARMAEAELTLSRQVRLKPTGAVSDASYDAARTTALVAKAQVIKSGEHGWLIRAGDPDELTKAMETRLDAPIPLLMAMGQAAHTRVCARHHIDIEASRLAKLFKASAECGKGILG
jgi:multidrug efflux pump subunit AcrA (membrane-fusion protein)